MSGVQSFGKIYHNGGVNSSMLTTETEHDDHWNFKHIAMHNHHYKPQQSVNYSLHNQSASSLQLNQSRHNHNQSRAQIFLKTEYQTIAEHYFVKTGVYLSKKNNPYLFKCSKERCLLDFSVQKSTIINNQAEESKHAKLEDSVI